MRIRWIILLYVVLEIAAFAGLTAWLGFGWALLITLGAAVGGYAFLVARGRRVVADLGRAARNEIRPTEPLPDTALLGLSSVLVILPGIVTTVLGVVLMAGPVRRVARPVVTAFGAKRVAGLVSAVGTRTVFLGGDVIDGEVVDTTDGTPVFQRQLPPAH
ncbi:FxsA family protein [Gordonia sp. X0973]|uniref:FxsA family protein n=1 Tax=Gordonia sp. X0973 TaxID=2742602 RepID=UPI000F53F1BA|nr:FxsA family protein [Gordonia sp. X0973]QKT07355.1 FxsA family protein [Gordonia sp. X0973]